MDFNILTGYIEDLYQHNLMTNAETFIRQTELKQFCPVIQTETARLLMLLLYLKRPSRVLEIGTSIGYSATSMAKVVRAWGGQIITIEFDRRVAEQAWRNFADHGVADVVELRFGDALQLLPAMRETFDFIFLDPFNDLYPQLLPDCVRLLNPGGVLIADDTLEPILEGYGLDNPLHQYNRLVAGLAEMESTVLPIGDGVTLAVKK